MCLSVCFKTLAYITKHNGKEMFVFVVFDVCCVNSFIPVDFYQQEINIKGNNNISNLAKNAYENGLRAGRSMF
jgi:hypothetical protein